ncbi:hypothetical protein [Neobacillus sp. NPDC093127]|uniref:hypothetical protein n=1 Tax=Neobacillus sp. NPDC093127 TaxID=3364296 RepID=UPI0037F1A229
MAAMQRVNITVDHEVLEQFFKLAEKKGIKISPFVNAKLKEFIEDEKLIEELKRKHSK